jgi:hypothetical protein
MIEARHPFRESYAPLEEPAHELNNILVGEKA